MWLSRITLDAHGRSAGGGGVLQVEQKVGVFNIVHVETTMRNLTPTVCVAEPPSAALSGPECSCVDSDVGNMWVAARGSIYTVGLNKQVSWIFVKALPCVLACTPVYMRGCIKT